MEELIKGRTVIAKKGVSDKKTGIVTEVEILYGGEETGYMRTMDGEIKRIPVPEQYKEILQEYRDRQRKEDAADQIMNEGEDDTDYYAQEDQETGPDEQDPGKQELVKAVAGSLEIQKKNGLRAGHRKLLVPVIILGAVILATLGVLLAQMLAKNNQKVQMPEESICIALLKHDIRTGDAVTADTFEPSYVSRETFDLLGRTMYIGPDGISREGAVMLWDDAGKYENCIALRSIEAGSVAMADDYSLSRSSLTGQTTLRLVAVITSDSLEENEIICELGRYVLETGTLSDILNAQNISVLGDMTGGHADSGSKTGEEDLPAEEEHPAQEGQPEEAGT